MKAFIRNTLLVVFISALFIEAILFVWLHYFASRTELLAYARYSDISEHDLQWAPHPYLSYFPRPGYRRGALVHNSLGFRGAELRERDTVSSRIVFLGGSTTYTEAVHSNSDVFTEVAQQRLKQAWSSNPEFVNAGVSGYNSTESLINLQVRVLNLQPDLIVIYHAVNDVHARFVEPTSYLSDNRGRRQAWTVPTESLLDRSIYLRILRRHAGTSPPIGLGYLVNAQGFRGYGSLSFSGSRNDEAEYVDMLTKNRPTFFVQNICNMIATARSNRVGVALMTWAYSDQVEGYTSLPYYKSGIEQHNFLIRTIARMTGVELYDLHSRMSSDPRYWSDDRHVNRDGSHLKGQLTAEWLSGIGEEGVLKLRQRELLDCPVDKIFDEYDTVYSPKKLT